MRRFLVILVLTAALMASLAVPAAAHAPCAGGTGMSYGRDHIASHAPHGHGVDAHNPGTHMGYSLCLGVHG